jgi:hypothetical protein
MNLHAALKKVLHRLEKAYAKAVAADDDALAESLALRRRWCSGLMGAFQRAKNHQEDGLRYRAWSDARREAECRGDW